MRIGYFTRPQAIFRTTTGAKSKARKLFPPLPEHYLENEERLHIPESTESDLEIFESNSDGKSLFELCNSTQTYGGRLRLRLRMKNPFSQTGKIIATQQALSSIGENRPLFGKVPFYLTSRLERYQKDPLRFVTHRNRFEFLVGALTIKMFDGHQYRRIYRGVEYTAIFTIGVREFLARIEPLEIQGELQPLCNRIRDLLDETAFAKIPAKSLKSLSFLKILRLDQAFRIYEKDEFVALLDAVYQLDALISLSDTTVKHGFVLPTPLDGPTQIQAEELYHPQLAEPVANGLSLDQQCRLLFLTGPNMAGKTTYLRAVATAIYLGQIGMGVPAREFSFTPVEQLFCSISVNDDIHSGTSYFHAEVNNVHDIASAIADGARVLAIMDEPFKGTNVKDALEASFAVMSRLQTKANCLFLVSSHLIELDELFKNQECTSIKRCYFEAQEAASNLLFDYKLQAGVSDQRLGMRVLTEKHVISLLDREAIS